MKSFQRPRPQAGFTVVETIIVLAIAGLILLIVLEAIPVLTRNSRNNQRRQDVNTILEAVSHYELNNSGDIPNTGILQGLVSTSTNKLSYYSPSEVSVTYTNLNTSSSIPSNNQDIDHVVVYNHGKCSASAQGDATNAGAGFNDVVALFAVETSGGKAPQCQQL